MSLNTKIDIINIFKLFLLASFIPPVLLQILQTLSTYIGIINKVDDWGTSRAVFPQAMLLWVIIIVISVILFTRKDKSTPVFWFSLVIFDIFLWISQVFFIAQGIH